MAKKYISNCTMIKNSLTQVQKQMESKYAVVPLYEVVKKESIVPRINLKLEPQEMEVLVEFNESLKECKDLKCLKVKINEKDDDDKEIIGHYFYPQKSDDNVHVIDLPQKVQKELKSYKLVVSVKESGFCGFGEKNIYKTEIKFREFANTNEIVQTIKFAKVKFDVIVRIRQCLNKKETMQKIEETFNVKQLYLAFDQWQAQQQPGKQPAQPAAQPSKPSVQPSGMSIDEMKQVSAKA